MSRAHLYPRVASNEKGAFGSSADQLTFFSIVALDTLVYEKGITLLQFERIMGYINLKVKTKKI